MMLSQEELKGVQGNLVSPYGFTFQHVAHLFAGIDANNVAPQRAFLRRLLETEQLTWGWWGDRKPATTVNIGLSHGGLVELVPELAREVALHFEAFAEGMPRRSRSLGDDDRFESRRWEARHLWLCVHAQHAADLDGAVARLRALAAPIDLSEETRGAAIVRDERIWYEHFGFRDDISYPAISGLHEPSPAELRGRGKWVDGRWLPIELGEFVLGHLNEKGKRPLADHSENVQRLLRGGTFAVLRKLQQNVAAFRDYIETLRDKVPGDPAAKLVGRERSGAPLAPVDSVEEEGDKLNNFTYQGDEFGARCPLGAHVRRANNREGGRHRLMRRGVSYGPELPDGVRDEGEQGLWFLAFNADIEDQFEFVQQEWLNSEVGNLSNSRDPLVGAGGARAMAIEGDAGEGRAPVLLRGIPNFVSCLGGQYYLYPGRSGIELLCAEPQPASGRR